MKNPFKITHILLTAVIVGGVIIPYIWYKDNKKAVYNFHCDAINKDLTRPPERMCIQPISIENNIFTFRTENNGLEVYAIIPLSGDVYRVGDDEEFGYNFIHYLSGD